MNVLGIDTSTSATAACVLRSDGQAFESRPAPAELLGPPGHSKHLLPAVMRQMDASGLAFAELDSVAVATGPGGYTGLRIGIATARSLGQAHALPLRPVGTLNALAAGIGEPVTLPVLDARRGQVFAALHLGGEERWEPFVVTPEGLLARLAGSHGDLPDAPTAAGDGSLRFRGALEAAGVRVPPDDSSLHVVRALHVCRLAVRAPAVASEAVAPRYLRAPDVTPSSR